MHGEDIRFSLENHRWKNTENILLCIFTRWDSINRTMSSQLHPFDLVHFMFGILSFFLTDLVSYGCYLQVGHDVGGWYKHVHMQTSQDYASQMACNNM